jgi:hypothetical protein
MRGEESAGHAESSEDYMVKAAAVALITLSGPGGQYVVVNAREIVSLRAPRANDHLAKDVRCIVFTVDSKFTGVAETCAEVRQKIEESR